MSNLQWRFTLWLLMSNNTTFNTEIIPFEIETNLPPLRVLGNVFRSVCVPIGKFVLLGQPHVRYLFVSRVMDLDLQCLRWATSGMAGESRILKRESSAWRQVQILEARHIQESSGADRCYIVYLQHICLVVKNLFPVGNYNSCELKWSGRI